LKERADRIQARITKAVEDMAGANALKAQYEECLKNIDQERQDILDKAHKLALEQSKDKIQEAKKEADAIRERAHMDIIREQEQVKDAMRLHIIDLASAMAEKFVAQNVDKETQDRLFSETMKELEEAAWPN
jgi:F-type H+-transporting ATPase subunit b